jgi:molecular chaperone DnaK
VEVSAKDQATGKQQSIRITHSSGLTQAEIDRLIKDAELHAGEDKAKKELIDARNTADSLIYATEKSMAELGDKLPMGTRNEVQGVISDLKRAMESDNTTDIKRLTETLTHASHRLAESVYQQPGSGAGQQSGTGPGGGYGSPPADRDEEVVDAEYEEVH